MSFETREVRPYPKPGHVFTLDGKILAIPAGWALLPPGDAALSRRIKEDGPTWTVIEVKGRKRFSHGIWAPAERITALRAERELEQQDPSYQRRLTAGRARRAAEQVEYVEDFRAAVQQYLDFAPRYTNEAAVLAGLIAQHATPVGSGTVARTERIPLEERAAAATIAWLRHQTTNYDDMRIERVAGRRREVRRELAARSVRLLDRYRRGDESDPRCPLRAVLAAAAPRPEPPAAPSAPVQSSLF